MKIYQIHADLGNDKIGLTEWFPWASAELLAREITQLGYRIIDIFEREI